MLAIKIEKMNGCHSLDSTNQLYFINASRSKQYWIIIPFDNDTSPNDALPNDAQTSLASLDDALPNHVPTIYF
jgi:hypothetical protein